MTRIALYVATLLLVTTVAAAQEPGWTFGAELGLGEKYDDNLDLQAKEDPDTPLQQELVTQTKMGASVSRLGASLDLDLRLGLRTDLPNSGLDRSRHYLDYEFFLSYRFNDHHALQQQVLTDCFFEPESPELDVCRIYEATSWYWAPSTAWRLQFGLEQINARYTTQSTLDYDTFGIFSEARYLYNYRLTLWARLTAHGYHGAFRSQASDPQAAPSNGVRLSNDLGIDWNSEDGRVSVLSTVRLEFDDSPDTQLQTVDGSSLRDDDLETDSQFNYRKVRTTHLLSWRASQRWQLGLYAEAMLISFVKKHLAQAEASDRDDVRLLVSPWARFGLAEGLAATARFSWRENISSVESEDYINRILAVGLEYRW